MKRIIQSLAPLCAMACSQGANQDATDAEFGTAQQAIEAIEGLDGELGGRCEAVAVQCEVEAGDGEPCDHVAQGCANMGAHLEERRRPVVECWESVKVCAQNGGDCADAMDACKAMGEESRHERGGAEGCFNAVHECVKGIGTGGPFAGENVSEACTFGDHGFGRADGGAPRGGLTPPDGDGPHEGFSLPDGGAPPGLGEPPEAFEPPEGVPDLDDGAFPSAPPDGLGDFDFPDAGSGFPPGPPQQ